MEKISDVVKLKSGYANIVELKSAFKATQENANRMVMYRPRLTAWQMTRHFFSEGVQRRFAQSRFDDIRELGCRALYKLDKD